MYKRVLILLTILSLLTTSLTLGASEVLAADPNGTNNNKGIYRGRITPAQRQAAAATQKAAKDKAKEAGLNVSTALITDASGHLVPDYFGNANWAFSPMPTAPVLSVTVINGGTGYTSPTVTITDSFGSGAGAIATAAVNATTGAIDTITVSPGGAGYIAPAVNITDPTGTGAAATAALDTTQLAGGLKKFIDPLPVLTMAVPDTTTYPAGGKGYVSAPTVTITDTTGTGATANATVSGGSVTSVNVITGGGNYSDSPVVVLSGGGATVNALAKATVTAGVITGITLLRSDYYEIELGQYTQKMHTDLPATTLRGYRQVNTTGPASVFSFLGPVIVAERDVPVRIKFINNLSTGTGGNLFIPVDTTVMGAGMGPLGMAAMPMDYTQNRATLHLHGSNTVWISDGTTHQWITPAGEMTDYPQGVSVSPVPDMNDNGDPRDGTMTFYYTNAQSARLMFYHDHSYGITRLNVYVGEAAGYLITDAVEQDMINGTNLSGVNPGGLKVLPGIGVPLVIQDRTFVDPNTIGKTDPTWLDPTQPTFGTNPGTAVAGDLWYPHVYMPAQNPWDLSGANPFGRWMYGPWFYPPTANLLHGTVPNPYYDPINATWEPPEMPGTPDPSMPGEAFMDTPIVNGMAYPYLDVDPTTYRFRILNACDDRSLNLQMYVANSTLMTADGRTNTEVDMVPVTGTDWLPPFDISGVPDPAKKGPDWIQIGTEGGFLPAPVVVPSQPITWNTNPTAFNFGNVVDHSLLLGAAERGDVVVDFSAFAGQTVILYNDAPAAFPAPDPRYDYFTGDADQTATGGAPSTLAGYGPNTRTIMQFRVGTTVATPTPDVTLANLQSVFAKTAGKRGVFEASQDTIIIPQAAYNSAYNAAFPTTAAAQFIQQNVNSYSFTPVGAASPVTLNIEPKAIHDEMGGVYDTEYGRMSGMLGLELPATTSRLAQFLAYGYASPPVDIVKGSVTGTPIGSLADGTQIWRITQNGVDTHTIHFHLFNVQLINRVGWDGAMIAPDANELGWKDTIRVNPLEHTMVALRPILPNANQVPFDIPNSVRSIDPTMPDGTPLTPPPPAGWFDPQGNTIAQINNHKVNFGWEYVYHCHILAHEEMDMMHAVAFAVPPKAPTSLTAAGKGSSVTLTWVNNSAKSATGFTVQRATDASFTTALTTFTVGPTVNSYTDTTIKGKTTYYYRVFAVNTVGDTATPGFPVVTVNSLFSNTVQYPITAPLTPPAAPASVTVTARNVNTNNDRATVAWTNPAGNNQTGFTIQMANNAAFNNPTTSNVAATATSFTTGNIPRNTALYFRIQATNAAGASAWVNATPFPITTP